MDAASAQGPVDTGLEKGVPQAGVGGNVPLTHSDESPADDDDDDDVDVPDVIEDVIEHLLTGLKDKVRPRIRIFGRNR